MARKSRKALVEQEQVEKSKVYSTAVYVRLSVENSGKADDGMSLENQTKICLEYLQEHPDLKLFDLYEDNGEKGTNMDRPEFLRMMDDIRSGKVNCIVVKDLSRFSRDYIDAGNYLEKVFPFLGVRFISITDHYDSLEADGDESALMVPLKNMMNAAYAKDISQKIITSFRARQEKCEILPSFAPYGYLKSKTRRFRYELDEKTAPFVRKIFEWTLEGRRWNEIIRLLNEQGAITPAGRKLELGIWHNEKFSKRRWSTKTITDMLRNPTYTGCIVYGRMPANLAEGIPWHRADRSEWRIFPDMHEAIVTTEEFEQVQKILEDKSEARKEQRKDLAKKRAKLINLFEGKIYCGDCGKRMRFLKTYISSGGFYSLRYACGGYLDSGNRECTRHSTPLEDVQGMVLTAIQEQMLFLNRFDKASKAGRMKDALASRKLAFISHELEVVRSQKNILFERFVECEISREEYDRQREELDAKESMLERELREGKKREKEHETVLGGLNEIGNMFGMNEWIKAVRKAGAEVEELTEKSVVRKAVTDVEEGTRKLGRPRQQQDIRLKIITKELVEELVDRVMIFEGKKVEVRLKFAEERGKLERLLEEIEDDEPENRTGKE